MQSEFGKLNLLDFGKGLLIAILTAIFAVIYTTVQAGSLTFDLKAIGIAALSGGLAYISKNLLTNSNNQLLSEEPKK